MVTAHDVKVTDLPSVAWLTGDHRVVGPGVDHDWSPSAGVFTR
jgi:hypothetical protein